jgi:lambda repressor-like predicted transcriptional regulator
VPAARQPRLPLEPLVQRCGSASALARATGIERTQLARWRRDGVPLDSADRVAIAVGRHPAEVWPDWYIVTALLDGQAA